MLLPYSKIVGSTIVEMKTQTKLGEVFDIVIQKKDFALGGVILKGSSLFSRGTRIVAETDIIEIISGAIVVRDTDSTINIDEAVRIKESIAKGLSGIGQKVVTKSGKTVGKVFDYLVDSNTNLIVKIYVKSLLTEKIIGRNSIKSIEKNKIVIKDDFEEVRFAAPAVESSLI